MKKFILFVVCFAFIVSASSQGHNELRALDKKEGFLTKDSVVYIVGSLSIPGYSIKPKSCHKDELIVLPNGREIAGLGHILKNKSEYIGGELAFNGDTTTIFNIELYPVDNGAVFVVSGSDFDMRFNLDNGVILDDKDMSMTFFTEKVGVWVIRKNNF